MGGSGKAYGGRDHDQCGGFHGVVLWFDLMSGYRSHDIHQPCE
jgi:hypothetical protein